MTCPQRYLTLALVLTTLAAPAAFAGPHKGVVGRLTPAEPVVVSGKLLTYEGQPFGNRQVHFRNTNLLVRNPTWDIGLQKTGYIAEAGRCLVMQAQLQGRKLIMVFLDSAGKYSRIGDAERVRKWINENAPAETLAAPKVTS